MQLSVRALGGSCRLKFEPDLTIFEMTCPAKVQASAAFDKSVCLSNSVYALAVDDSQFQRQILEGILNDMGIPGARRIICGGSGDDILKLSDTIVDLLEADSSPVPPNAFLLAMVDENLVLSQTGDVILGSLAVQEARRRLSRANEARLLAFVRSANDSAEDTRLYAERAHGWLDKQPGRDRQTVLERCFERFGPESITKSVSSKERNSLMSVAIAELQEHCKVIDDWSELPWKQVWLSLHSLKGSIMSCVTLLGDDVLSNKIVSTIGKIRRCTDTPGDFAETWHGLRALVDVYIMDELRG